MKAPNVLMLMPMDEEAKKQLEASAPEGSFTYTKASEATDAQVEKADVIIGNLPPARLQNAKNLKWMQLNSAGTNGYLEQEIFKGQAQLTNATGSYGLAISEHMLGVMLYFYKRLNQYHQNHKARLWRDEGVVRSVEGARVLIVGLGDIGGEFAKRLKALGAVTVGVRRSDTRKPEYLDELYLTEELDRLLPEADVVAIAVPGLESTAKMFDKKRLSLMKKDALLINVGRGTVVDTDALCALLDEGHFMGVALDVTDPEPLPEDHRLWGYPNVLITPHVSGGYHLRQTYERILGIAVKNLALFVNGKELDNQVDFQSGYTKKM